MLDVLDIKARSGNFLSERHLYMPTGQVSLIKKIANEASKHETDSYVITFNIKTNQLNSTHMVRNMR